MNNETWLERLQSHPVRFFHIGMGADLAALPAIEAWGLYSFLLRLTDG